MNCLEKIIQTRILRYMSIGSGEGRMGNMGYVKMKMDEMVIVWEENGAVRRLARK